MENKLTTCNGSKATVTMPLGEYERIKAKSVISCKKIDEAVNEKTKDLEEKLSLNYKDYASWREKMSEKFYNSKSELERQLYRANFWMKFAFISFSVVFISLVLVLVLIW